MAAPDNRGLTVNELAHALSTARLMIGSVPDDMPGGKAFFTRHDGQVIPVALARRLIARLHPEPGA